MENGVNLEGFELNAAANGDKVLTVLLATLLAWSLCKTIVLAVENLNNIVLIYNLSHSEIHTPWHNDFLIYKNNESFLRHMKQRMREI